MTPGLKKGLILLALLAIGTGNIAYKLFLFHNLPASSGQDGKTFFWTESAFHFRHFLMVAGGKGIPAIDQAIQYPEGLDTSRYITPVMERVAGTLYRCFFSGTPTHLFVAYFSILVSTLSVLAAFLAARVVWHSAATALICAAFYAFTPASLHRSASGGFLREDFALPFIFLSFACFLFCLRRDSPRVAALGSVSLALALTAWHATQLYVSLFGVSLALVYLVQRGEGFPRRSLLVYVAAMALAGLFIPVLRAKYFPFSPALMVGYGLAGLLWIPALWGNRKKPGILTAAALLLLLSVGSLAIQRGPENYSHVYDLLLAKVRFLGSLPADPARLSFEAKCMWTSAFVSPQPTELPILLAFSLPFGVIGTGIMTARIMRRKANAQELVLVYFALSTFLLFLMIHRMSVFAVFFLAVAMGTLTTLWRGKRAHLLYGFVSICLLIQCSLLPSLKLLVFQPNHEDVSGLLAFIKTGTDENCPVLTSFELGPAVALYSNHPVILHSKFESKILRDKVKRVYLTLYQPEEEFYQLCRELRADLFVYQTGMALDHAPGGMRYLTGAIPLQTDKAAFLFHFAPEKLRHFTLLYQNPTYRLYQVGGSASAGVSQPLYEPIYDLSLYLDKKNLGGSISDDILDAGIRRLGQAETYAGAGEKLLSTGEYEDALRQFDRALRLEPGNKRAISGLVRAASAAGHDERLNERLLRTAAAADPDFDFTALRIKDARLWIALAEEKLAQSRYVQGQALFSKALEISPGDETAKYGLGTTWFAMKRFDKAEPLFRDIVASNPLHYRAYESLGKVCALRGDLEKAIECVERSLAIHPSQPQLVGVRDELKREWQAKKKSGAPFESYLAMAERKASEGDLEGAERLYLEAAAMRETPSVMYSLGLVCHRMDRDDEALGYLRVALAMKPDDEQVKSLVKDILRTRGATGKIEDPKSPATQ